VRRTLTAVLAAALLLSAGCGQRAGVHERLRTGRAFGAVGPSVAPPASGDPAHEPRRPEQRSPDGSQVFAADEFVTWPEWAAHLLPRIGAPACTNNVVSVVAWAAQEGTVAGWNPLATTYGMPGSTRFNSVGVRNYISLDQGLDATVLTIESGLVDHGYGAIVAELQRCAPSMATARAIRASNWCAGCAGGRYVTGMIRAVSRPS